MDLLARTTGQSLSQLIGGTRARIPVGVSLGIQPRLEQLLERVDSLPGPGLSANQAQDQAGLGCGHSPRGPAAIILRSCFQLMRTLLTSSRIGIILKPSMISGC